MRVLLVEDAPRLRGTIAKALVKLGHAVDEAGDGIEGAALAREGGYDVVVLDRMLPGRDGLSVLEEMRARRDETPVLLLTALDSVARRVEGFSRGADDYLTKPFALEELAARIEALARRRYGLADPVLELGSLRLDLGAKAVTVNGAPVPLKPREFALLACLAIRPGRVMSRIQIEEQLYGEEAVPSSNAVDSAICSLRKHLGEAGSLLRTRRGLGYVLELPAS